VRKREISEARKSPPAKKKTGRCTQLVAMRNFCSNIAGLLIIILAYQVFLKEAPDGSGGALSGEGYHNLSLAVALAMFASILIATVGTHRQIKWLRPAPARTPKLTEMFRQAAATLHNRSFVAVAVAGMCTAISVGLKGALDIYWFLYLFGMKQSQVAAITAIGMGGTLTAALLGPPVIRKLGKRRAGMSVVFCSLVLTTGPMSLWLLGLTPAPGSLALFVLLAADQFLNSGMWFMIGVCTVAMMADVVEDAEVKTGRRSEGLLFAAENLFKKMVGGLGVFSAGMILTLVAFPKGAERDAVPHEVLTHLALLYLPAVALLHMGAIASLSLFRISRATHEANLRILAARSSAEPAPRPEQAKAPGLPVQSATRPRSKPA